MARAVVASLALPTLSLSVSSFNFHSKNDLSSQDVEDWALSPDSDFGFSSFSLQYENDLGKLSVGNWKTLTLEPEVFTTNAGVEVKHETWDIKYNGDSFASFDFPEIGAHIQNTQTNLWSNSEYATGLGKCVDDLTTSGSVSLDLSVTYSTTYEGTTYGSGSGTMEKKLLCNSTLWEVPANGRNDSMRVYLECQTSESMEGWASSSYSDFRFSNFVLGYSDNLKKLAVGNWKKMTIEPEEFTTPYGTEVNYEAWDVKYNGDSFASFDYPELGPDVNPTANTLWSNSQYATELGNCVDDLKASGSVSLDLTVTYSTTSGSFAIDKNLLCNSTLWEDTVSGERTRVYLECQAQNPIIDSEVENLLEDHKPKTIVRKSLQLAVDSHGEIS